MEMLGLGPDSQALARRRGTSQSDDQRLFLPAGQVAMHQRFRAKRLDQVDQQAPDARGVCRQSGDARPLPAFVHRQME